MDGYVHVTYDAIRKRPAQPKEFLDAQVMRYDREIQDTLKQPLGQRMVGGIRAARDYYASRYTAQPDARGTAEYWGSKSGLKWLTTFSDALTYNGEYVNETANGILFNDDQSRTVHTRGEIQRHDLADSRLDIDVPYLGFYQPGKGLFLAKNGSVLRTSSGYRQRSSASDGISEFLVNYDSLGRATFVEVKKKGFTAFTYALTDYSRFGTAFWYPKSITETRYTLYDTPTRTSQSAIEEVRLYRATAIDNKPVDKEVFDGNYPQRGVDIYDNRAKLGLGTKGVMYNYSNRQFSVDENSMAVAREARDKSRSSGILPFVIQAVCLSIVLLILGRIVLTLMKARQKEGK